VIGLYMMFGRFFARRWVRDRTVYGLTNRRVISIAASLRGTRRVSSVWLGSFPAVDKRVGRDGRGTVWIGTFPFGARSLASDPGWPGSGRATGNAIVLADIPDAGEVYALINRQLSDMTSPRAEH